MKILNKCNEKEINALKNKFAQSGFVLLSDYFCQDLKKVVSNEVLDLIDKHAERRDLKLETTGNTPRRMSVVRSEIIGAKGKEIVKISKSNELLFFLKKIAREEVYPKVSKDEEFLITKQEQKGDTHGWHWGDYSFALIWIIDTPPVEYGGMLQCVPHSFWDKNHPNINQWLVDNVISTYGFIPGDIYFLRTDTTLHRTVPLTEDKTRIILNMTFSSIKEIDKNMLDQDRWWENKAAEKAKEL